jgi:heptosyltransferase-3
VRVTVFRAGGLGDTLLVLPALAALHREVPGARVTLVGSAWASEVRPMLDLRLDTAEFGSPRLTPLFSEGLGADPTGLLAEADAAVVYDADAESVLARNARRLCAGVVVVWGARPQRREHAAVHFARAVLEAPGPDDVPVPRLLVSGGRTEWARRWLQTHTGTDAGGVAVHPGSGGRLKCWPAARFADLLGGLPGPVVILGGPADAAEVDALVRAIRGRDRPAVARALPLARAAALLSVCRLYVGNDSGISHLAAALGIPTVAVFGPTDPAVWAPRGRAVETVAPSQGAGLDWPTARQVALAVRRLLHRPL